VQPRPLYDYSTHVQELGLDISDKAIEQMKANLVLDEAQMKVAAEEEKKRRRGLSPDVKRRPADAQTT